MKKLCFSKYYDDSSQSYEYYYYGAVLYSSENLEETEVETLIHYLEEK